MPIEESRRFGVHLNLQCHIGGFNSTTRRLRKKKMNDDLNWFLRFALFSGPRRGVGKRVAFCLVELELNREYGR